MFFGISVAIDSSFLLSHSLVITRNHFWVSIYILDKVALEIQTYNVNLNHLMVSLLIIFIYLVFQDHSVGNVKCIIDFEFFTRLIVENNYDLYVIWVLYDLESPNYFSWNSKVLV